ncbi:hypothetical protein [Bradyrhizobium sp. S3.2.12]|uniref:hypothetical protein n=1 Tax=Bradyrhizobium sp. S3.2.12 TaxID=3156387 RepID=UPI003391089E
MDKTRQPIENAVPPLDDSGNAANGQGGNGGRRPHQVLKTRGIGEARSDVEEVDLPALAQALKGHREALTYADREVILDARDTSKRIETRRNLIEPEERDPNGIERVLGASNLCSINFLARGLQAAASIARIRVRLKDGSVLKRFPRLSGERHVSLFGSDRDKRTFGGRRAAKLP